MLPPETVAVLKQAEEDTRDRPGATVNLAVGYGGRREIADAVRSLLAEHAARGTTLDELVEALEIEHIAEHLYTRGQPDPDLVIRTSGEQRHVGVPALADRERGVPLHRRLLARLPPGRLPAGTARLRRATPAVRRLIGPPVRGRRPGLQNCRAWQPSTFPSSTCGWGCASTAWRPASSTRTRAIRGSPPRWPPRPRPRRRLLRDQARGLLRELDAADLPADRVDYLRGQLAGLECTGRKMNGEPVGFVEEVRSYFQVDVVLGDESVYAAAHAELDVLLPGSGSLAERYAAHRRREECPPDRLEVAVHALSSALRDRVRGQYGLPEVETVHYEVVTDQPWSGFNYYEGDYRSRVAINADLPHRLGHLPHLVAHEAYPGHHTEHCRKERGLVERAARTEHTVFLVNTPECLMAEGLADLGVQASIGNGWGPWAAEILGDLGPALRRPPRRAGLGGGRPAEPGAPGRRDPAARPRGRHRGRGGLPAALVAGQRRAGGSADPVPHPPAVAGLHLHLRRGLRPAVPVAGGAAGRPGDRRSVRLAARRAADPAQPTAELPRHDLARGTPVRPGHSGCGRRAGSARLLLGWAALARRPLGPVAGAAGPLVWALVALRPRLSPSALRRRALASR